MDAVTVTFSPGYAGGRGFSLEYSGPASRMSGPLSLAGVVAELRAAGLTDGDALRRLVLRAVADGDATHSF